MSFSKVNWNPASSADINFVFQHHYLPCTNATGSWNGITSAWYCYFSCTDSLIYWGKNAIIYVGLHDVGHALFCDGYLSWHSGGCQHYSGAPSSRDWYSDKAYWDWRLRNFTKASSDCDRPIDYNTQEDLDLSVMDYDATGKAKWLPGGIGFWGRPEDPDIGQPCYLSKFDIDSVVHYYDAPNFYPILTMSLHKNWSEIDYHGGFCGYATKNWESANRLVRSFQSPSDLRDIFGLAWKNQSSTNSRVQYYK